MLAIAERMIMEPPDGKKYEWRKMIELSKVLGRPLTDAGAEEFKIEQSKTTTGWCRNW